MTITLEDARDHIRTWQDKLSKPIRYWPKYLFHSTHVTTAAEILRSGQLIPRTHLDNIIHDVANRGALHNNPDAHQYCRFYFRPKTNFHLKTEGIKLFSDPYRQEHHMSVPILLLFNAEKILTAPNVSYTCGNYASHYSAIGNNGEFFNSLDFSKIYHDAAPNQQDGEHIRHMRMSEVLYEGILPIQDYIEYVVCRSAWDKRTLISLCEPRVVQNYERKIRTLSSPETAFFGAAGGSTNITYITSLLQKNRGLEFILRRPKSVPQSGYGITIFQWHNQNRIQVHQAQYQIGNRFIELPSHSPRKDTLWEINVEDSLAFRGEIPTDEYLVL